MGVPLIFLSGGEPLLRKDIYKLIMLCKEYGILTALSTNGILLKQDTVERLARLEVHYIAVPIYGPEELHDVYVGFNGSFSKVVENIKQLETIM